MRRWLWTVMGGIKFDWLAVWILSPDWLSQFYQSVCEAAVNGGGECGPAPTLHPIAWHLLYN